MTIAQACPGFVWKEKNTPYGDSLYYQIENDSIQQLLFLKQPLKFNA